MEGKPGEAKSNKTRMLHTKKRLLQLQRREELSHNIRYISKVPVRIVMNREVLKLHPSDSLSKLVYELRGEKSCAVVVDGKDHLKGFITMKDLLHFFQPPKRYSIVGISMLKRYSMNRTSHVKDIMVKKPITISVEENLGKAIGLMIETGKHHLPVVDGEGKVHGIIEVRDIIRLVRIVSS